MDRHPPASPTSGPVTSRSSPLGAVGRPVGPLARSEDDRVVAGVASGLGHRLGVDPVLVRIGFVVLAFAGGVGIVLYGVLWAITSPVADTPTTTTRPTVQQAVAFALITLGALLLLRGLGLWFGDAVVWPIVIAAAGSAIVWTRGDDVATGPTSRASAAVRARLTARGGPSAALARAIAGPVSPARVITGTVLVGLAVAGFLAGQDALLAVRELGLAVAAAAVGVVLLFGPWFTRVLDELGHERRARVRQEERAELAAHLHDSVLQTLALIQRSSDDPRRIASLARVQERELRAWLYGSGRASPAAPPVTLTDAVEQVAGEVEATHLLAVDVVVVGDAAVDDRVRALLGAIREAATNAAKHAGVDEIDVYVEASDQRHNGEDEVVAYVRDRGVGFDPATVLAAADSDHRRGLRDSIVARLERHGGRAQIWSAPGEGTEVELAVPRAATPPAPEVLP